MASITGRETTVAFKKGAAWRTAVAAGAGDGILITSESVFSSHKVEKLPDKALGKAFPVTEYKGRETVAGKLESFLRYQGLDTLIAMVIGEAGAPSSLPGSTLGFEHIMQIQKHNRGLYGTLAAIMSSAEVMEVPSLKPTGFTIKAEMGMLATISLDAIGNVKTKTGDTLPAPVNTIATMANVTVPADAVTNGIVLDPNCYVRLNGQADPALSSTYDIPVASLELALSRKQAGDFLTNTSDLGINEPISTDYPDMTLALEFPTYEDSHSFVKQLRDSQAKKCEILFKGQLIELTYNFEIKIILPHLRIAEAAPGLTGAGKIPYSAKFNIYEAIAAPAGMSYTNPITFVIHNKRSTDALA
jgi:hypothetical protein